MKLVIFAVLLALALIGFTVFFGSMIVDECDQLLYQLSQRDIETFEANWQRFSQIAAFVTPYDLIRTAESNASHYLALTKSDASSPDLESARQILISSIRDIRRVHSVSWELIF